MCFHFLAFQVSSIGIRIIYLFILSSIVLIQGKQNYNTLLYMGGCLGANSLQLGNK